ncbi:MAG: ferrous iron transport protein B [Firmicutes bacterium]|nr:ferrous iron transport protein B [Bacillota bacterium]
MILALVGNQNCGKTTLFNQLTGANQHVGNFPGVTVDQKMGEVRGQKDCQVVDLPGVYSLRPYTGEEVVTHDFLVDSHPDGVINIVDATNIERNLYLTLQLLELRIPTVLALNFMDELTGNGGSVDIEALSEGLGVPVVPISASRNEGVDELIRCVTQAVKNDLRPARIDFCPSGPVHRCIHAVSHVVEDHAERMNIPARFAATNLVGGDPKLADKLGLNENEQELIEHSVQEMTGERGLDRVGCLASMRYEFILDLVKRTFRKPEVSRERQRSVAIDKILTHRVFAIPVFIAIMGLIFWLTFGVIGAWLSDLLSAGIDWLTLLVDKGLTAYGLNPVVHSLIIDGVFAGVGSVLSFLPLIVTLFFFLSILEDTGYMARVAFVMDKLLRGVGLNGRSFVPMIIGFGCSVPAIMATRTLSSERDRRLTILLTPFMSCSAKVPIYAVFCAAFFLRGKALVMSGLYVCGIAMGILAALILGKTVFREKPAPFVMELPNYRFPSWKSILLLMWEKAYDFLTRAFTIIFMASIIIWFLQTFDTRLNLVAESSESILAQLGQLLAPVFKPMGYGDWRVVTSLVSGLMAKEAVVGTMGVLLGCSAQELATALPALFTTQSALSFLVFALLYTPCFAAIATIRRELASVWQTVLVVLGQCAVAWLVSFVVYRIVLLF